MSCLSHSTSELYNVRYKTSRESAVKCPKQKMNRASSVSISFLVLIFFVGKSFQNPQHLQLDRSDSNSLRKNQNSEGFNLSDADKIRHFLDNDSRPKRSSNDILDLSDSDIDEILMPSLPLSVNLESLPPLIRYLVEQKLSEQRSRMKPRLGRDMDDDVECQRPRPPFAPRLGKKSVPFKPRLGRQAYDDVRC